MSAAATPRGPALVSPGGEGDPRLDLDRDELAMASRNAFPVVAQSKRRSDAMGLALGAVVAVLLGGVTLLSLSHGRATPIVETPVTTATSAPVTAARPAVAPFPLPGPVMPLVKPSIPVVAISGAASPAMVYDGPTAAAPVTTAAADAAAKPGDAKADGKGDDTEQFLARANSAVDTATAEKLDDPANTITQGTLISAVLETALDSDLPGYARALVTEPVRSFDGSKVLIPRYSRLIGQYKSGIATGQKRAFVVWTRLIRPDGVSLALGSPGVDFSGQAGLTGKVYNHYLQRYGSAVMLSVLTGLAGGSNNAAVISTGNSASSVLAQHDTQISPTIKVSAGSPIRVFMARDLDFSTVGDAGRRP